MGTISRIQAKKVTLTKSSGSLSFPLIPKIIEFLDRVKRSPAFHCGVCYFGQAFRSLLLPKKEGWL
jgi:hypothetical protein